MSDWVANDFTEPDVPLVDVRIRQPFGEYEDRFGVKSESLLWDDFGDKTGQIDFWREAAAKEQSE